MSLDLVRVRAALSKVSPDLKKGQHISAANAIREGARLFGRVPMMKNEQDEIVRLIKDGCEHLKYNTDISRLFPLAIEYTPGQEADLINLIDQLVEALEATSLDEARERQRAHQEQQLEKGQQELDRHAYDDARNTLGLLGNDFSGEADVIHSIAEMFLQAGLLEDAAKYLELSSSLMPDSARVLNKLGIVLRRMKDYEKSEQAFARAVTLETSDPNLHFNFGRLYIDTAQWDKALVQGEKALALSPDFSEAAKMVRYARKQLGD